MAAVDTVKRLLVGRKLASNQLGETLVPQRIALAVFALVALSSVAYAPDEILLTLSLAGFAFSRQVALLACSFSSGCAALTGVEAISNGVPAFRAPTSHNAAATLALLGGIAISMLGGIIVLANLTGAKLIDQTGLVIKTRLSFIPGIMVTNVPDLLASSRYAIERLHRSDEAAWRRPGTGTIHAGSHRDE